MYLLNTRTYEMRNFYDDSLRPPYAILSHVWLKEGEVTFRDIQDLTKAKKKEGFKKIAACCKIALNDGYRWVWIDTCCIDKESSAELSEAINSMYRWYSEAVVCYAYLLDVKVEDPSAEGSSFRTSKWFTRGWTLQELIAPQEMYFLSEKWERLGTRRSLLDVLHEVTNVNRLVLLHEKLPDDVSVARRMSWAAYRETTRVEDRAYSLMGIFNVNMPTIYGEGEKAFIRLQLAIINQSPDHSIFAWGTVHSYQVFIDNLNSFSDGNTWSSEYRSLLASSPRMFAGSEDIETVPIDALARRLKLTIPTPDYQFTNYGIHIHLPLYTMNNSQTCFALLACKDRRGTIGLLVRRKGADSSQFYVGLHGANRPLAHPWHPHFRVFRVPEKEKGAERYLAKLAVANMYIHSHNPNPQRSHALGIADKQLRVYSLIETKRPEKFAFIIDAWLIKQLRQMGFRLPGIGGGGEKKRAGEKKTGGGDDKKKGDEKKTGAGGEKKNGDEKKTVEDRPGWTPSQAWKLKDSLMLTMSASQSETRQAVVLFRGPKEEAFALVVGVTKTGLAWAEGLVKGCEGSQDGDWDGSGYDSAKKIQGKYTDVDGRVKEMSLEKWRGGKKFGDKKRAVKVTFKPWLDPKEGVIGNGTLTYTIEMELQGPRFMELATPSITTTEADDARSNVAVEERSRAGF